LATSELANLSFFAAVTIKERSQYHGKVVAAKVIVYAGEDEEYFSFISLEARQELNE
jgi:hypothetical protein